MRLLDRQAVAPAGGVGLGLQVTRTDGVTVPGQVQVDIDYSGFKYAYGGDFASRLRLVKLPACALQTPDAEDCTDREFVPAENDPATGTLTATVVADPDGDGLSTQLDSTSGSVYALTTGSSSDKGDYRASTLSPTGSWDVATGSGAFTYNLPVQLPSPATGSAPDLGLTYNSQSVDGRTSATNNQASWVGMGWDLNVGYIERKYRNCTQDGLATIGDMCWDSPNTAAEPDGAVYVINLNGVSSTLVQDGTGTGSYHVQNDPGWRVQHLNGGHGADDEYWVISSQDGQRYYFGWGRSERTGTATASVFTIPVVGNDAGEPCHDKFPEPCTQAWRWNLDRVVDANEVESAYFYDKDTNYYRSVANTDKARSYTAGGYLTKIEYGWATQIANSKPTGKVELTHVGRCVERMTEADPLRNESRACPSISSTPSSYPDVPVDLLCDGSAADYYCAGKTYYPTFFSKDMLWDIKTFVLNTSADGWDLVQQYQTKHGLPNPDGSIGKTLWLDYVQRKTYGTGTDIVLPVINFNGIDLDNKVGSTELNFRRVNTIHGDLGATTTVSYGSPNPCSADNLPSQSSNTQDCFWQKWTPEGDTASKSGWFKKFLVTQVTVDPTVTSSQDGAPEMTTSYDYQGGAGWRFTNDPLTPDSDESWSDWRGYQRVEVTSGTGPVKHSTFHWLYRGLDGDRTSKTDPSATRSVSVTDGEGTSYTDSAWLQGRTIETSARDDAGSSHERVFHHYWTHTTATYAGLPDARFVREDQTTTDTKISTGWRTHVVQNEYDAGTATSATYGLPLRVDDQGEQGVVDNRCTTYGRAYNTDFYDGSSIQRWMVLLDETRHYSVGCASRDADHQDRYATTFYDNATDIAGNKPVDGNPTETRTYTTSSHYQQAKSGYDGAGRARWTEDAYANRTTTSYSPENNWPTDGITTTSPDPDGLASARGPLSTTVWMSRFWGVPYQSKDANGNITKVTLDAAGRPIEVWKPTETGSSPSLKFSYTVPASTSGGVPDSVDGYPRVATHTLQSDSTYLSSYAYADGLGRARETQAPIPDGTDPSTGAEVPNRQVAVTRYDTAGNVTGTSAVFRNQGTAGSGGPVSPKVEDLPSYTDLTLDWAGRTTLSQILVGDGTTARGVAQGRVQTAYHGDYSTVTPAVGGATDTYTDVYGQISKVVEHSGSSTYATQYLYTATGDLQQITDTRGNDTVYNYNWAGQHTRVADPDARITLTEYDDNGQVDKVTSNKGQTVLDYSYDNLGRKTAVTSDTAVLASWVWDGLTVPGGKGQITAATSQDTSGNTYTVKTNAFDGRGRPLSTTISIPAGVTGLAGDYTASSTYDAADHLTSVTYPKAGGLDEETVTTTYNAYGQPRSLASGQQTYVRNTVYDAYGLLTDRYYGGPTGAVSGVAAQRTYSYYYAGGTRWLRGIATTTTVGQYTSEKQQDLYDHDDTGRITELREQASGQTVQSQCFRYDGQGRLTSAYTRAGLGVCSLYSSSDFTGEAPYQTAYTYDRLGNLQSVTDTSDTGAATTRDYLYPGYDDAGNWTTANAPSPHGVRKINHITAGTTTGTDTFTYDDAGQMDTRIEPGTSTDYDWTKLGQLSTVKTTTSAGSQLTRYTYGADGNLLLRTTPQETVAYLGGMELHTDGQTTTATRYYACGGATVAMRTTTGTTTTGGKLTYLMADTQASTQLAVDATTGTTTRRRYTPFGDERSGTLPTGTDHGFLGKTEDTSTGLSLLGARAYDPHLGRFLSPDPLNTPYIPQNLSAYSYSINDPINYSDPSGLSFTAEDHSSGNNDCSLTEIVCSDEVPVDQLPDHESGGDDYNHDGYATIHPGVNVPIIWSKKDEFIAAFFADMDDYSCQSGEQNRCYYVAPDEPYADFRASIAAKGLASLLFRACGEVAGSSTCPVAGGSTGEMVAAMGELSAMTGGGEGPGSGGGIGRGGCPNSFTPDTEVLMADGSTKPIGEIEPEDKTLATDPETGETEARTVLATIVTKSDKDFSELTLSSSNGKAKVTATRHHPFWSPSRHAWVDAGELKPGMTLLTNTDARATVTAIRSFHGSHETRNLTIDGLHTYYVLAGQTPVLVHNSNCSGIGRDLIGGQEQFHIIHGDRTGGGHKWPGQPGKTVFPRGWDTDKILDSIADVATSPNSVRTQQTGRAGALYTRNGDPSRWKVEGVVDGVNIRVIYEPATGRIVTGFPYRP
ncbi:RHS repeat-associated core domain-containing protein [Streptomyces sp. NPDC020996]|uniref:RHS repeat-associated core domain-containing protein n=1 Tax=Streptomyces sp. NPDC020996 TaxID=3154791 RepID=UPI00340C0A1E